MHGGINNYYKTYINERPSNPRSRNTTPGFLYTTIVMNNKLNIQTIYVLTYVPHRNLCYKTEFLLESPCNQTIIIINRKSLLQQIKCMHTLCTHSYTITPRCFRNSSDPGDRKVWSNVRSLYIIVWADYIVNGGVRLLHLHISLCFYGVGKNTFKLHWTLHLSASH